MGLTKKPVTGMKDILPEEMQIRDYLISEIKKTYRSFGFSAMETPCVEHIENLCSKQGGENEKLIFKVLKRGEKLNLAECEKEADLVDCGLRYDLTVPLARYYSNQCAVLPSPFKAVQIGNVWRADKPQRGRFRQFMQCDIDILGDPTNLAEIELILATSTLLSKLSFSGFNIRINDRRILKAMALYSGFGEEDFDAVFIILDKMDKIGLDGVKEELDKYGFDAEAGAKYIQLFEKLKNEDNPISYLKGVLGEALETGTAENLTEIFDAVNSAKCDECTLVFDPTLVRGMSYYTGTIFEIEMPEFSSSVGGGGRYDKMIGKFTGTDTPACGFSIGFERIITILMEKGYKVPNTAAKTAFLVEKGVSAKDLGSIIKQAQQERENGKTVLVSRMNKNKKFQKEQLMKDGYEEFCDFYREPLKN